MFDPVVKICFGILFLAGVAVIGVAVLMFVPVLLIGLLGLVLCLACAEGKRRLTRG